MGNRNFYCYSNPLKNFLVENGIRYTSKNLHQKTKRVYWVFDGNDKLNSLLAEWRNKK